MNTILGPIEWVVSWIMVQFHGALTAVGMNTNGGLTWALSIVGLVLVIRTLLIPLFVKQIRSQRGMQMLQPKIKELQKRHKDDRERQSQEMMKLYKETGTNPLSSCLPIVAQAPIFFALFRVLNGVAHGKGLGVFAGDPALVASASHAKLFGAPISSTFLKAGDYTGSVTNIHIVAAILILLMSASMFFTQRQLMTKNMPATALEGPFAQQQKIMLYIFPLIFLVTGVNFPIGVLVYWFTTNIWSMCQQLVVIARMPAPGSLAETRLQERRQARESKGATAVIAEVPVVEQPRGQRQQPKRNAKNKRPAAPKGPVSQDRDTPGAEAS